MVQLEEAAAVRRLADRLGFPLGGEALRAAQEAGYDATVQRLLDPVGPDRGVAATPPPVLERVERPTKNAANDGDKKAYRQSVRQQQLQSIIWWLDRMVAAEQPTTERLTWFWHGHFATSAQKVRQPALMLAQNETFRRLGRGGFPDLAQALIIDPALLIWLDGNDNTVTAPNENLSREFLELFALGHGHYTESDVQQGARALTGWKINRRTGQVLLRPALHDEQAKTLLGQTGNFDAAGFVRVAVAQPQCARWIAARLWFRLVSDQPPPAATLERLTDAYADGTTAVLAAIAAEEAFRDASTSLVKQPVEWLVGLLRAVGLRPSAAPERVQKRLLACLQGMGQVPFRPPSVGGWPAGGSWLTTAAARARVEAARAVGSAADFGDQLKVPSRSRADQVQRMLGVDRLTARTRAAIDQVADNLPAAFAVAACAPEYVVSA